MLKTFAIALVAVAAVATGLAVGTGEIASAAGGNGKSNCSNSGSPHTSDHPLDNIGEFLSFNAKNFGFNAENNPGNPKNDEWPPFAPNWDASVFFGIEGPFPNCNPNAEPFTP